MNTARIVVLTVAVGAGSIAPCLASGFDNEPPPAAPTAEWPTIDVLVARSGIGFGLRSEQIDANSSDHKSSKRGDSVKVVRDDISTAMTTVKWPKGRNI